jgi:uncharacterized protein YbbK (DUF523 family)
VAVALLKESSPSCGTREVYDGAFEGRKVTGEGVTAHLLREHGVAVFNENEVSRAADRLLALEAG